MCLDLEFYRKLRKKKKNKMVIAQAQYNELVLIPKSRFEFLTRSNNKSVLPPSPNSGVGAVGEIGTVNIKQLNSLPTAGVNVEKITMTHSEKNHNGTNEKGGVNMTLKKKTENDNNDEELKQFPPSTSISESNGENRENIPNSSNSVINESLGISSNDFSFDPIQTQEKNSPNHPVESVGSQTDNITKKSVETQTESNSEPPLLSPPSSQTSSSPSLSSRLICEHCGKSFVTIYSKKRHAKLHNIIDSPSATDDAAHRYVCEICGLKFKNMKEKLNHMKINHQLSSSPFPSGSKSHQTNVVNWLRFSPSGIRTGGNKKNKQLMKSKIPIPIRNKNKQLMKSKIPIPIRKKKN